MTPLGILPIISYYPPTTVVGYLIIKSWYILYKYYPPPYHIRSGGTRVHEAVPNPMNPPPPPSLHSLPLSKGVRWGGVGVGWGWGGGG